MQYQGQTINFFIGKQKGLAGQNGKFLVKSKNHARNIYEKIYKCIVNSRDTHEKNHQRIVKNHKRIVNSRDTHEKNYRGLIKSKDHARNTYEQNYRDLIKSKDHARNIRNKNQRGQTKLDLVRQNQKNIQQIYDRQLELTKKELNKNIKGVIEKQQRMEITFNQNIDTKIGSVQRKLQKMNETLHQKADNIQEKQQNMQIRIIDLKNQTDSMKFHQLKSEEQIKKSLVCLTAQTERLGINIKFNFYALTIDFQSNINPVIKNISSKLDQVHQDNKKLLALIDKMEKKFEKNQKQTERQC